MNRMNIKGEKDSSKNVWDMFDDNNFDSIENRTTQELKAILDIYRELQNKIVHKKTRQMVKKDFAKPKSIKHK